ncbi:hypothetical protein CONCODRAFT_11375 [Conidiobolus coronatus NRRL 28638]|uniref:Uncharacterized protein n=1 Tax=Conidiobolus coronatus (strain ATCC 28846 / CBS 209.66 / NRRL 28638) TaxID=796925 RepID=A0A137NV78_CONC2|nr:hypothetical protein CONCODRAFT_11375 [Conidiobolus coronatus NRRL 28638]|eukprot:KXN66725.1 hypothetical protein CONCODRAFT_11375 [Conidiobolus coronatus NRRL 28638]
MSQILNTVQSTGYREVQEKEIQPGIFYATFGVASIQARGPMAQDQQIPSGFGNPRPDLSYHKGTTETCCWYAGKSIGSDGYCYGEDTHGDGWYSKFDYCCGGHTSITGAYCINDLCPSSSIEFSKDPVITSSYSSTN